MKSILIFFTCLFMSVSIYSQKYGSISGKISSTTNEVLPFASVILKDENKKLVEGTVTNEKGAFTFSKIANGMYTLEIQYIGFTTKMMQITLNNKSNKLNLDTIQLKEDATSLDEIVVQGEKSEVTLKLGKKVFNVGKDLTSQNGSATNVLNNVPSVSVSPTGAVSLRGNTNVQVLINGRRSALTQADALDQISADIIESVEVITSPSAKQDASGSSGIINIILKKNRKSGINGQVRLVSGIPDDFRALGNLNYKTNKFNFFTNFGIRYTDYEGTYLKEQTTINNGISTFLNQNEDENRHDDGKLFYLGTDYYINDKNSITVAFYRNNTEDTDVTYLNYDYSEAGNKTQTLFTEGNSKEKRNYNQLEANYTKMFDKEGSKFTIDFQYDFWNSLKNWYLDTKETFPFIKTNSVIRTNGKGKTNDLALQTDYTTTLGENSNLEIGAKFENRNINNQFLAEQLENGNFETIDNIDNDLDYKEKIISVYTQFNSKINKFSYQLGLRLETTNIQINASDAALNLKNKYTNLFPSATIGYVFKENFNGQISYSKRIGRPSLWYLSPFFELKDFTSKFTGNPALKPSFTDALEVSFIYRKNKFQLNPSIYYATTKDVFQFETIQDSKGVFVQSPINLDNEKRYGLELSASYSVLKWLRLMGDFNAYAFKQSGIINAKNANISDKTWFVNLTASLKPSNTLQIQARLYHEGEKANAQTITAPITYVNFAVSKSILKNKGSINFNLSNPFDSSKSREKIIGDNFNINQIRSRNAQRYTLSFVYKFNQKSTDKNREAKNSNRN